jgi:hypothetical protein
MLIAVEELVEMVHAVLRNGSTASMHTVVVAPRTPKPTS